MPRLKRTGDYNRLIVRNSKVYAASVLNSPMNGLFAYRDLAVGEILVQYTGTVLSQREANESNSQYLFDLYYRSRPGADTVVRKTIDGVGELMGFANHAPEHLANASAVDLLPSIIDNDISFKGRHALVLVAKTRIPKGTEVRFNYNSDQGDDGDMARMMRRKGVTDAQMNDRSWKSQRYITPPERNHAGVIEIDFPYEFISEIDSG